nr:MAG TPA: hypothetical protein [Caudoviricetes sp.]
MTGAGAKPLAPYRSRIVLPRLRCQCQKCKKSFNINGSGIFPDCVGSVPEPRKEVP